MTSSAIVATYDYRDADGKVLYQKLRYEPKGFSQRRPDGSGWSNKLDGPGGLDGRRVIYRWPEILKYPDAPVFVCEGEKDADRVATLNLCAATADN